MNRHLSTEFWLRLTNFKDSDFKKTRDALKAKQKQPKRHGLERDQKPQRPYGRRN